MLKKLLPGKLELLVHFLIALCIAVVGNAWFFNEQLQRQIDDPETPLNVMSYYLNQFLAFLDGFQAVPTLVVFIIWSLVGVVVFTMAQTAAGMVNELKEDVKISTSYFHPKNFSYRDFWVSALSELLSKVVYYVLLVAWSLVLGYIAVPATLFSSRQLLNTIDPYVVVNFIASLVLLTFTITVFFELFKLFAARR